MLGVFTSYAQQKDPKIVFTQIGKDHAIKN